VQHGARINDSRLAASPLRASSAIFSIVEPQDARVSWDPVELGILPLSEDRRID